MSWTQDGYITTIRDSKGKIIAHVYGSNPQAVVIAELIASAPDLLAERDRLRDALRQIADHCPEDPSETLEIRQARMNSHMAGHIARAALAKVDA